MGIISKMTGKDKKEEEMMNRQDKDIVVVAGGLPTQSDVLNSMVTPAEERTDLSKVTDLLVNKENENHVLERLTDLSQTQINGITPLLVYAEKYNIRVLKDLIYKYLSLQYSKGRMSRSEIVDMFKNPQYPQMDEAGGRLSAIVNRIRR